MRWEGGAAVRRDASSEGGARLGSPLSRSAADKAGTLVVATLPFVLGYLLRVTYLVAHPDLEPYMDFAVLRVLQRGLLATFLAGLCALAAWPWLRRHDPDGVAYPTLVLIGWFTVLTLATYCVGPYTTPALAGVLAGAMGALILFEFRIAVSGFGAGLGVLLATTVAERLRWIPYGPLYRSLPTDHGHPTDAFIVTNALFMAALFAVILTILALAMRAWRLADAEVRRLATVDPLTQLKNRRHLFERMRAEMDRSRRYGSPLTLMLVDLDHFKAINDLHGHVVGDRLLAAIARTVEERGLRTVDVAARYGGEELALLLPETDAQGAEVVGERLRALVAATQVPAADGEPVRVTASFGVAVYPDDRIERLEDLVRLADEALYQAKADGRDRVVFAR